MRPRQPPPGLGSSNGQVAWLRFFLIRLRCLSLILRQHEPAILLRPFGNYTRTWSWSSVSVRRFLQVTGWQMDVGLQRSRE